MCNATAHTFLMKVANTTFPKTVIYLLSSVNKNYEQLEHQHQHQHCQTNEQLRYELEISMTNQVLSHKNLKYLQ